MWVCTCSCYFKWTLLDISNARFFPLSETFWIRCKRWKRINKSSIFSIQYILAGDCKLETFSIVLNEGEEKVFLKACFGINVEEDTDKISYKSKSRIEVINNQWVFKYISLTLQLYSNDRDFPTQLIHFKDDLMTIIDKNRITFKKFDIETKPELIANAHAVQLNKAYTKWLWFSCWQYL